MSKFVDVPNFFQAVYLVDLSPSLLRVAEDRFSRLGWKNVKVVCQDARRFHLGHQEDYQNISRSDGQNSVLDEKVSSQHAELITMSYALSMIPEFYPVVDSLSSLLSPNGVMGVSDFYVQSSVDYQSRNYIGGEIDRHCMWISRVFWRTWFEADRVSLEAARRVRVYVSTMKLVLNRCSRTIWSIASALFSVSMLAITFSGFVYLTTSGSAAPRIRVPLSSS